MSNFSAMSWLEQVAFFEMMITLYQTNTLSWIL